MADRNRRFRLAAIVLPFLFLAMSNTARAAMLFVTNTNDSGTGSLRNQIAAAASGDTIEFNVTGTISLLSGLVISENLTIIGPTAAPGITLNGGGLGNMVVIATFGGTVVNLQNLTIANATTVGDGAGISNSGTLTVINCTFSHNSAAFGGGISNGGTLTVINSTFLGNSASQSGGAIENADATLTVTNSTFSNNSAIAGFGGGIDNFFSATLTVTNDTFSGNSAGVGGGGIHNEPLASTTLKGTILAAEPGGNCGGLVTDAGYNISDDLSCPLASGTSLNEIALNLDPAGLQNNGGPTQTIALEPNSPAVDFIPVASCKDQEAIPQPLMTDQRGFPRPDSGNTSFCDAGAFELQTGRITVLPGSEKTQIARSTSGTSDQVNMGFTFTDNGSPILDDPPSILGAHCDDGTDALNGIDVDLYEGTCADLATATGGLLLDLSPFVVHTVNHQSYGTLFQSDPPDTLQQMSETVSATIVQLATPLGTCGQWTVNIEVAGLDTASIGLGGGNPFALVVEDGDKNEGCFDVTNAIVGSQIPAPSHSVRRGVRRQTRR
jgi:predicted outer membrane repeat protein